MIGAVGSAMSGLSTCGSRMAATADTVANLATVRPGGAAGTPVHEPEHPLADAQGYVSYPDIDLGEQVGNMIGAQRGYEANLVTLDRAMDAYRAVLDLLRQEPGPAEQPAPAG